MDDKILEDMSDICHQEWMSWSQNISKELNIVIDVLKKDIEFFENNDIEHKEAIEILDKLEYRLERWEKLWIPYEELSEEEKDSDRKYALKMFNIAKKEFERIK